MIPLIPGIKELLIPSVAPKTHTVCLQQITEESLIQAKLTDESGFAKNVLNNPEEDCWNEL